MFLCSATEQDIRETCELLEGKFKEQKAARNILPLYARLSGGEQSRVFSHMAGRKIIVSTNVAETSVTIPGIKYVVDTGLARIAQYSPGSRTTSIPVTPISKSSADQRKGRCGRVENGICVRLFSEEDFDARPLFTPPEILRSNLAEVILRMIALNLGDISDFPFIDKPASKNIKDGFDLLFEFGAIQNSKLETRNLKLGTRNSKKRFSLTEKGRLMAKMPIDPRLSRMLIEAQKEGCLGEIAVIASALTLQQDPRERPVEKEKEADRAHAIFKDTTSDFVTLLNIWNQYHVAWQTVKSGNKMKNFCKEHFLSFKRMREWRDIHAQITSILEESFGNSNVPNSNSQTLIPDTHLPVSDAKYAGIHKSVLSGFLSNIALKKEKNIFKAAKDKEVMIFPGSGLFDKAGTWIVAAQMVETSRLFARTVANIDVSWLEELGKEQCKSVYLQPHWERNRGEVVAFEQVSLYGLVIVPRRSVSYGKINPDDANHIFIESALVEGDLKQPFPFMEHNEKLISEVRDMENRIRRRDILVSDLDIYEFYKEKLSGILDIRSLKNCLKKKGNDEFLRMKKDDLFLYSPDEKELALYPDSIAVGNNHLDCIYSFEPGKHDDGVTVRVSSAVVPSLSAEVMDWLVPGLLEEKITALIKGLPKAYRKKLVPVGNTVDMILNEMPEVKLEKLETRNSELGTRNSELETRNSNFRLPNSSIITALRIFNYRRFGVSIPASAWDSDALPDHLRMRISITGPGGKELCAGRDKNILNKNISDKIDPDALESAKKDWERTGITAWDFKDLPDTVPLKGKNSDKWIVYPGLEPDEKCVNLRVFRQQNEALSSHKKGIVRLFTIHFSKDLKFLKKNLALSGETKNQTQYFGGTGIFEKRLYHSIINELFCKNIRTKNEFYAYAESVSHTMFSIGKEKINSVMRILQAYHCSRSTLYELEKSGRANNGAINFLRGLREELSRLVPEKFMDLYDTDQMIRLERYIKAITIRAERGLVNLEKDQTKAKDIKIYNNSLNTLLKSLSPSVSEEKRNATEEFFWLIEEYKVSLFCPGT